jgi:hypothetical protein
VLGEGMRVGVVFVALVWMECGRRSDGQGVWLVLSYTREEWTRWEEGERQCLLLRRGSEKVHVTRDLDGDGDGILKG